MEGVNLDIKPDQMEGVNLDIKPDQMEGVNKKNSPSRKRKFRNDTHEDLRNRKTLAVRRGKNRMSRYYRCNGNVYI